MNPGIHWQKIEDLFNQAVQLPLQSRIPFVMNQTGGDVELCQEVVSLLAADSQSNEILNETIFPLVARLLDEDFVDLLKKTNFAHYKLLELIGRGGMGAVFKAQDISLEREVALKVLPSTTATNPESVMRFQQEAKAASAISHPHVAHIYEFGSYDGLYFLAMEFVEGKTLRELITEGKVDLKSAIEIAIQIAKALNAAHSRGIIHRDIKPENVMIDHEKICKVLDFGLAKLNEKKWRKGTNSLETIPGVVIGTSAYMSPEQVRGQTVDERTDIWSLGVVLYEMLAGTRPFDGETTSDIQAAILLKEPAPLPVAKELPELEKIVRKALQKNVDERYQSVREMLDDLQKAQRTVYSFLKIDDELAAVPQSFLERIGGSSYLAGIFILLFVILVAGSFFLLSDFGAPKSDSKVAVEKTQRVTNTGKALQVALASDGETAAYVLEEGGREALYLKRLNGNGNSARLIVPPLTEKGGFVGVSFSPDNQFIYYAFKAEGIYASLYRMPTTGGEPQKILDDIDSAPGFSPDGSRLVFLRISPEGDREDLLIANADGGNMQVFYTRRTPDYIPHKATPVWSPDGQMIACPIGANDQQGGKKVNLVGIRLADAAVVPLSTDDWAQIAQVAWAGDGKSLALTARKNEAREEKQVWRVAVPGGEATALTDDPNDYEGIATARSGQSVLTIAINRKVDVWLQNYGDAGGKQEQLTFGEDVGNGIAWTFDDRIVYSSTASGNSDIWIMNGAGGDARHLTFDPNADTQPVVSPDNRYIVFLSTRSGKRQIWRMNLDGSNQIQLTNATNEASTPTVTADSRNIIYFSQSENGSALFRISIDGGAPEIVAQGVRRFPFASLDGKWLVSSCRAPNEAKNKICIAPMDNLATLARVFEPVVGANSPSKLRWIGRDSQTFAYIVNNRGVENLWKQSIDGSVASPLTDFKEDYIYAFDWSPDGKKLICGRGNTSNSAVLFTLKN